MVGQCRFSAGNLFLMRLMSQKRTESKISPVLKKDYKSGTRKEKAFYEQKSLLFKDSLNATHNQLEHKRSQISFCQSRKNQQRGNNQQEKPRCLHQQFGKRVGAGLTKDPPDHLEAEPHSHCTRKQSAGSSNIPCGRMPARIKRQPSS